MALDSFLLSALLCPENRTPLRVAAPKVVSTVNTLIKNKTLRNRGGENIAKKIEGVLIREDEQVAYLVRDGIPLMVIDESIQMADVPTL